MRWAQEPVVGSEARGASHLWLHAGGTALVPLPARQVAGGPALGLGFRPVERYSLGVVVVGPLTGLDVDAKEASATVHFVTLGVDVSYHFLPKGSIDADVGLTAGSVHVSAEGRTEGRWLGVRTSRWVMSFGAATGLVWNVAAGVGLRLDVRGLWCFPRPLVRVASERFVVARPAVLAGLGIVAAL